MRPVRAPPSMTSEVERTPGSCSYLGGVGSHRAACPFIGGHQPPCPNSSLWHRLQEGAHHWVPIDARKGGIPENQHLMCAPHGGITTLNCTALPTPCPPRWMMEPLMILKEADSRTRFWIPPLPCSPLSWVFNTTIYTYKHLPSGLLPHTTSRLWGPVPKAPVARALKAQRASKPPPRHHQSPLVLGQRRSAPRSNRRLVFSPHRIGNSRQ